MLHWIRCVLLLSVAIAPFSAAHAASIDVVAFDGQNPDFRFHTFNRWSPVVDEAGGVFFGGVFGSGIGPSSGGYFVWQDGVVSPSTRPNVQRPASLPVLGDPVPGDPGAIWSHTPSAKINRNGAALVFSPYWASTDRLLLYDAAGTGSLLVSSRDAAPGTSDRVFSEFSPRPSGYGTPWLDPDLNDRGDVVFEASLARIRTDGELNETGSGIWTVPATTGSIQPLVLSGASVPGQPSLTFQRFIRTEIDAAGRVAFLGDMVDPAERVERALFFAGPGGDITLAVREGDLLPGVPNDLRVSGLDDLLLNDAGLAVMTVNTIDGSSKTGAAVVSVTSTGKLDVLLRTGQEILTGDRSRIVGKFSFRTPRGVVSPDLGPLVGDWLTLWVEFENLDEPVAGRKADGQAILRIRVPEPALAMLLLIAAAVARRVRG